MAENQRDSDIWIVGDDRHSKPSAGKILSALGGMLFLAVAIWFVYNQFRIEVDPGEMAILIKKTGRNISNHEVVAPSIEYKGIQQQVLTEGRHFKDPYNYEWMIIKQIEIPQGKVGVKISMFGDELENGQFLAKIDESGNAISKGIVRDVLRPARYSINPFMYKVEEVDPVVIPAGFKGVVTLLTGAEPKNSNSLLVEEGERGVQQKTLGPKTHYVNPYIQRISQVDCRTKRFNLAEKKDMGFPSKDGFWVSLDGIVQFRVNPEKAAEVYVTFNDESNGDEIYEEIVNKVILPNARSFCRLEGSSKLGREFIEGVTRTQFQESFQEEMKAACEPLGIEISQVLITKIRPPEKIALPVRERELALQQEKAYQEQIKQQEEERKLAEKKEMVKQKQALIKIEQDIVKVTIEAKREQEIAVTRANQDLAVAQFKLDAAKDKASAIHARGKAAADVIGFENLADAAGWKRAVEAFQGEGADYARFVLYQKLSTAYRNVMINTADSPLMKIFDTFTTKSSNKTVPVKLQNKNESSAPAETEKQSIKNTQIDK